MNYTQNEIIEHLQKEVTELRAWKASMLAVEAQCDMQELGKMLGMALGTDIRANLIPKVKELLKQNEVMRQELIRVLGREQISRDIQARLHNFPVVDPPEWVKKVQSVLLLSQWKEGA